MEEPIKPNEDDCCNSGCDPCIFDVYEKQLNNYRKLKNCKEISLPSFTCNGISQTEYTNFVISEINYITDSIKIIYFNRDKKLSHKKVWWNPGQHFLVKYTSDPITCTRAYTPIADDCEAKHDFYIILKKYEDGLVSKALFSLNEGDKSLWRGPYGSFQVDKNKYKRIIMVAQGTGLAPFISIIESILNDEDNLTLLTLFFCCHDIKSILVRNKLYAYKAFWNFSYSVFVTSCCNDCLKYKEPIVERKLATQDLDELKPSSSDQFLLCGSKTFMNGYKCHLLGLNNISNGNIFLF